MSRFSLASLVVCLALAAPAFAAHKIPEIVVTVDTSGGNPSAADLQTLHDVADKAERTAKAWYGKIEELTGAKDHPEPQKVTISFNYTYQGIAATGGDHTDVNIPYTLGHPDDIPGVIVHELTHVVQHYTKDSGWDTGWLTEGIADYVRWFNFEPESKRPHPRLSRHPKATGSYQTTASFLFYVTNKYDKSLVKELNQSLYDAKYTPEIWKTKTGKSFSELETEWLTTLS